MPRKRSIHTSASDDPQATQFSHIVQFYEEDAFLIETVGRYLGPALASTGAGIVVATRPHLDALADELEVRGVDVGAALRKGRYVALDAAQLLAEFMVEGSPDPARFLREVGEIIARSRAASSGERNPAVFGEMVALLWGEGKREAALRLEQLWNELSRTHSFSLFCAYPLSGFDREKHGRLFFNICGEHSEVNPAEGYPVQGSEKQRRRAVAQLQQKTRALENEIRLSQERVLLLQSTGPAGTWEMDMLDETICLSTKAASLLGVAPGPIRLPELLELMAYSGDRKGVLAALKRVSTGRKEFVAEFRLARAGEIRVLSIRGKTVYNNGQPLILGVLSDVTPNLQAA